MLKKVKGFFSKRKIICSSNKAEYFPPDFVVKSGLGSYIASELNGYFLGQVLGATSHIDAKLNAFESDVLSKLKSQLKNTGNLFASLPRTEHSLDSLKTLLDSSSDVNNEEVIKLLKTDPVVLADAAVLAESLKYQKGKPLESFDDMINALGISGLIELVEISAKRPVLGQNDGHFVEIAAPKLLRHAENTAEISVELAKMDGLNDFDAYLAGLLNNLGLFVGCHILDAVFDGKHSPNSKKFRQDFYDLCLKLTTALAREWKLPELVCQVFEMQSHGTSRDECCRESINLYVADKLAKAHMMPQRLDLSGKEIRVLVNRTHRAIDFSGIRLV
jgi:HD-like signal output (HDOD) protein